MSTSAPANPLAVAKTDAEKTAMQKRIDSHVAAKRAENAMVAQIRGTAWGLGIDHKTTRAVSNYCLEMGLDPVRHVEVLGGKIYLTAEFYQERGAPLIRSGQIVPSEPEFINVDPRLDALIAGDDAETAAWAKAEKARRVKARIEHNAPEAAVSTCVFRLTIATTGQTVVGVNWCGGGTRKKQTRDRGLVDGDPIGDLEPTKTSITRAARRAWKQVADVIIDYGAKVKPIEARAEIINDELEVASVPAEQAQLSSGDGGRALGETEDDVPAAARTETDSGAVAVDPRVVRARAFDRFITLVRNTNRSPDEQRELLAIEEQYPDFEVPA